ncbi:MAG: hypothetical protein ACE37F_02075 [Nannocystaceae bacterium]|nr:hypothetical protein [bacterium]
MAHRIRPARWSARPPAARRFKLGGYRAPAPDPDADAELEFEHHGEYLALRDGLFRRLLRKPARKIRGASNQRGRA